MRNFVLLLFFLLNCLLLNAQFTPGNIVVSRVGDGLTPLSSNATQVQLVEYTTAGALVTTVTLPTANGGPGIRACTNDGTALNEGFLSRSYDGKYLVHCGYDVSAGLPNVVTVAANRSIAKIDATGVVNTSTSYLPAVYSAVNINGATSDDGTQFWSSGGSAPTGGVWYVPFGTDNAAGTQISANTANTRGISIFNGQLYVSAASNSIRIGTVGAGLPTTGGQTITNLTGLPTSALTPNSYMFFDRDPAVVGVDLLYVASQSAVLGEFGLFKYSFDGTSWTAQGSVETNAQLFGLTGYLDCSGNVVLYTTRATLPTALPTEIWQFTDNNAYNAIITNSGNDFLTSSTLLVSATANYAFRGIAMSPGQGFSVTGVQAIGAGNYNTIRVKSGGTATLGGNIVVYDKIIVENGGTLDMGSNIIMSPAGIGSSFEVQSGGTIKIGSAGGISASGATGNVQTCFRTYAQGANYTYTGAFNQVTGDGLPVTVSGILTILNAAGPNTTGVTLTQTTTLTSGGLVMNGGNLTLGNNGLISNIIALTAIPSHANNHIVTNGTGTFTVTTVSTSPIPFPIGPSVDSLNAVSLNTAAGTNSFSVRVVKGISPGIALPTYGINRSWIINSTGAVSGITLGLLYNTNDANPGALPQPQLMEILFHNGTSWNIILPFLMPAATPFGDWIVGGAPVNTITNTPHSYAIGISGAWILPVDYFISARAQKINNSGMISWTVANADNSSSFEIQRSINNAAWTTIGRVNSASNQTSYSYNDATLEKGTSLYRIKVTLPSGSIKYSNTIALINDSKGLLITSIVPNPVHANAIINISTAIQGAINFEVYDIAGHQVKTWISSARDGSNTINTDLRELPAGIYHIIAYNQETRTVSRFVKQ